MSEKVKKITADAVKIEDGKVIITDDELANLISTEGSEMFSEEEAGLNLCLGCICS